jgi:dTDP-4-amino-4,6-dideoxygalactose transaminase
MELGSEFNLRLEELGETRNSIYYKLNNYHTYYLDSGRSALKLLLKEIKKGEVLLPEYICDSVIWAFSEFNINYYRLKEDLSIDANDIRSKVNANTRVVYIMHYFGALQPEEILTKILLMKNYNNFVIIEDTTHSFFSKMHTIGDYCICSLRKWFAIPDGGILYSTKPLDLCNIKNLKRNTSIDKVYGMIIKTLYLDRKIESNLLYRKILTDAEKKIDENEQNKEISSFSEYLLKCQDTVHLTTRRKENYTYLLNKIATLGLRPIIKVEEDSCPFVLPITIDGRDDLREYLKENRIYCAVHWPIESASLYKNNRSRKLSERILSLPIDQRYELEEMSYLARVLKNYKEIIKCR